MPSGKASGLRFTKYQFRTTFRQLKKCSCVKLFGRSHGLEVTIFESFGAWGSVLCLREILRLTVCKISILNDVSATEWFSYRKTKREVSRLGSDPFWTFQSLRKSITPSGKTYGLPYSKYQFSRTFRQLKVFSYRKIKGGSPSREVAIFGRFGAWGSVLCPPTKLTAYRLQNNNLNDVSGT